MDQSRMKNLSKKYKPHPVDTSDIILSEEIEKLVEIIAKNVHEVWSEKRIGQGWTYGEQRDDDRKTHPCLVPYEELPEEEKEYDRNTAVGTLKLIRELCFTITKNSLCAASHSSSNA